MRIPKLIAAVVFVILTGSPPAVRSETQVVFTVDVETNAIPLPQQVDAVCQGGVSCGVMEIAQRLKDRGWAGTFFLNVYEDRRWGKEILRDLARSLQGAGQDVALHTHPGWAYDAARPGMNQYSLDDQISIIRDGVQLLENWTGRPVVAHRAGDYSADERTLEALERNGLRIDSSLFWKNPRSKLNGLGLPRNIPSNRGLLLEIPVTVYQREEQPALLSNIVTPVTSIRKIDVNWFIDEEETRAAVDSVIEANIPVLVVFLHSFSLMTKSDGTLPTADLRALGNFNAIMDRVAERHLKVVTMRALAESSAAASLVQGPDNVPRVTVRVTLPRYLWHWLRIPGNITLAMGTVIIALLVVGTVLVAVRRRRSPSGTGNNCNQERDCP